VAAHLLSYALGGSSTPNNGVWTYKAVNDYMKSPEQFAIREKNNKGLRVYSYVQALYRPGSTSKNGPYALRVYVQTSAGQGYDVTIANDRYATIIRGGTF
jgi:hypothetical protein